MHVSSAALRERLIETIVAHPGSNTRAVADILGHTESTIDYHLRRLEREQRVVSEARGRNRLWYVTGCALCPVLRRLVPVLRRPEAGRVARALDATPTSSHRLAERADLPVGQVRWIAPLLVDAFVASRSVSGRVALREGATICLDRAEAGKTCDLWGACAMSRAWADRPPELTSSPSPCSRALRRGRSSGPRRAPSSG